MDNGTQFEQILRTIFEEVDLFTSAGEKLQGVDSTQNDLTARQTELRHLTAQINALLAGEIRRQGPALDVWLDRRDNVRVKYGDRARQLALQPDVRNKSWTIGNSPFERAFQKYYGEAMGRPPAELAKAIVTFFSKNYKSLGTR